MAEARFDREHGAVQAGDPSGGSAPPAPRWVKVFGVIAAALLVTIIILHVTGRGFRHGDHTTPPDDTPASRHGGHEHPEGGHP